MAKAKITTGDVRFGQSKPKAKTKKKADYMLRFRNIPDALHLLEECLEADLERGLLSAKDYNTLEKATHRLLHAIMFCNCGIEVHESQGNDNIRRSAKAENRLWQVDFIDVPIKTGISPAMVDIDA